MEFFGGESEMQGDGSVGVVTGIVPRWYERTLWKSRSGLPYLPFKDLFRGLAFNQIIIQRWT